MPLTLKLTQQSSIPLEVDSIQMEAVREQSVDEIKATLIQRGNEQRPLGDFFDVSGNAQEDETIVWQGNCSKVKLIGTHLKSGTIRIEGDAGMHLGAEMSGGSIELFGNADDWVGAEMHGGRIHVHGNAGHLVGAAYRGAAKGMTGGEILIDGNAGDEIGRSMRRGTIVIGGRSGDAPGYHMIAGSIFLFGESGIRPGAGMKRGTIAYLGLEEVPEVLPSFKYAGNFQPTFLRFYLLQLRDMGFDIPDACLDFSYKRYRGDFLELGKGEILIRC